jgi:hypothetical protein
VTPNVTRNEVDGSDHGLPEKPAALPLLQLAAVVAGVGGLPNWLRGFDSRRPLPWPADSLSKAIFEDRT